MTVQRAVFDDGKTRAMLTEAHSGKWDGKRHIFNLDAGDQRDVYDFKDSSALNLDFKSEYGNNVRKLKPELVQ
jgi:hypothetical protein